MNFWTLVAFLRSKADLPRRGTSGLGSSSFLVLPQFCGLAPQKCQKQIENLFRLAVGVSVKGDIYLLVYLLQPQCNRAGNNFHSIIVTSLNILQDEESAEKDISNKSDEEERKSVEKEESNVDDSTEKESPTKRDESTTD